VRIRGVGLEYIFAQLLESDYLVNPIQELDAEKLLEIRGKIRFSIIFLCCTKAQ